MHPPKVMEARSFLPEVRMGSFMAPPPVIPFSTPRFLSIPSIPLNQSIASERSATSMRSSRRAKLRVQPRLGVSSELPLVLQESTHPGRFRAEAVILGIVEGEDLALRRRERLDRLR